MKRFLRRWLDLEKPRVAAAPPSEPPSITRKQVADIEERLDILEGQFNRWRGRQTGGLAHKPKPQEEPDDQAPSRQDAPGSTNGGEEVLDRWQLTKLAKEGKRGVLQR